MTLVSREHPTVATLAQKVTAGFVIYGPVRTGRTASVAFAVGTYIAAAYYFTSSTSFANPAVTVARMLSDTFAGIAPSSVPGFLLAQLIGAVLAVATIRLMFAQNEQ